MSGMGIKHHNWEDTTVKRMIIFLYNEGYSLRKIAELCCSTADTVTKRLVEWGIHTKGKK